MSEQCSEKVYDSVGSWGSRPCQRKGVVFEEDKWWCKQHSKAGKETRQAAQEGRWEQDWQGREQARARHQEERRRAECFPDLLAALKSCRAWLECTPFPSNDVVLRDSAALLLVVTVAPAIEKGEGT